MAQHKYKSLGPQEALTYIKEHHGIQKPHPIFPSCKFYECDDNVLILENTIENKYTLYFDREKYYKGLERTLKYSKQSTFKQNQGIIIEIERNKDSLLATLFQELGIERRQNLSNTSLHEIDAKLKKYGLDNVYDKLMLNLIVFCGEYVREQRGGRWEVQRYPSYPDELIPVFIDSAGRNYYDVINGPLVTDYFKYNKISVSAVVADALRPEFKLQVVPNPGMRNPNER